MLGSKGLVPCLVVAAGMAIGADVKDAPAPAAGPMKVLFIGNSLTSGNQLPKMLLYMTWARQKEPKSQAAITDAYLAIGRELGAIVVPVGLARQAALAANPSAGIYVADGKHPSPAGTYLASCLFYAMLSDHSPKGLPAVVPGAKSGQAALVELSDAEAEFYQRIAEETARATPDARPPDLAPADAGNKDETTR